MTADLADTARAVIDGTAYMTLGTADADGTPWVSPVWFASANYRDFVWVSKPGARHSRNLAARPELSAVVFDSGVPMGTGGGVYLTGRGGEVEEADVAEWIEVFSRESLAQGGRVWSADDVTGDARLRLYRATLPEVYIGGRDDLRTEVVISHD